MLAKLLSSLQTSLIDWCERWNAVAVFGMVPFIKLCLGTMLPMLGMAKQDNMRWVLATGHHLILVSW